MTDTFNSLPSDLAAAHALILAERAARVESQARAARAEANLTHAHATASSADALIARLRLEIEKLRRTLYGVRSERKERVIDQLEMQLEDAEADATEDELAAERAAPSTVGQILRTRAAGSKAIPGPFAARAGRDRCAESCPCCGSTKLSKLGEDVTETLEVVPRQWKVIQTVRERFSCRQCEAITQPPAPFHVTPRGFAGPSLLAMILFEKFGQHQPLNRQSERYSREGVELSLSTLSDQVGACAAALRPLHGLIERHVLAGDRLHGDDTTVPILAKGQTVTGRVWVYVRDDRPFGGKDPPAALFYASRDRTRGASRAASGRLRRHSAGRRLRWLQPPLPSRPQAWPDSRGAVLEPRAAEVLRVGRHRGECPAGQECAADLADRVGGRQTHRRALRHRARDQWPFGRESAGGAAGEERTIGRRARGMDARRARQTLATRRGC